MRIERFTSGIYGTSGICITSNNLYFRDITFFTTSHKLGCGLDLISGPGGSIAPGRKRLTWNDENVIQCQNLFTCFESHARAYIFSILKLSISLSGEVGT